MPSQNLSPRCPMRRIVSHGLPLSHDLKQIVTTWFAEIWTGRRVAAIDELMAPDCTVQLEGVDGPVTRSALKAYCSAFFYAVPDLRVELMLIIGDGDTCIAHWHLTGTHLGPGMGIPATGRPVNVKGVSTFQFRHGMIVGGFDRWNRGEFLAGLMEVRPLDATTIVALTKRELQVALLMTERLTHAEIAASLGISANTARRHCERVLTKLGVSRRQDVAAALGKTRGSVLNRHGSDIAEATAG